MNANWVWLCKATLSFKMLILMWYGRGHAACKDLLFTWLTHVGHHTKSLIKSCWWAKQYVDCKLFVTLFNTSIGTMKWICYYTTIRAVRYDSNSTSHFLISSTQRLKNTSASSLGKQRPINENIGRFLSILVNPKKEKPHHPLGSDNLKLTIYRFGSILVQTLKKVLTQNHKMSPK